MKNQKIEITKGEYEKVKHLIKQEEGKYELLEDLVGGIVFIRTVTHYYTGKLKNISGNFLHLTSAAWIADTGRFAGFMKGAEANEVEPMGETFVNVGSIIDISPYSVLPTTQK